MHLLTDSFITPHGETKLKGQSLFRFDIIYHNRVGEYYVQSESEFYEWINQLWNSTGYSEVFQKYEIIDTIKSCLPAQIMKVKCRDSDRVYCLKSICKKEMPIRDLEDIKIEGEIMKVCQFPYIVKLYDVYDSLDFSYLGKLLFE